jgi:glycosyltransferase involved in cell wall biosynthesis
VLGHLHVVPQESAARLRTLRAIDRFVDAWVTLAPSSARALGRNGLEAEWIANPVALSPNGHAPAAADGALRLLFVGRYGRSKGCLELVTALASLRRSGTDVTLRFVGSELRDGEERMLREQIAERGLEDAVEFAGVQASDELARSYSGAHALVLPSYGEGVPLVVLEAMAFGLPVIATSVGGIPDFVRDGEDGLLVPPRDAEALGEAIDALARDPELRTRLGESARAHVAREAGSETIVRRWREVYAGLEARA